MRGGTAGGDAGPPRVVCLGGGYVAVFLVKALKQAIQRGEIDVTIISRENFQTFHGFVGEMLGGRIQPGQINSPARRIFAPATFHNAEITSIDLDRRTVVTSRRLDGREFEVGYDHLVFGLGSRDDLERYPGLAEHALVLRDYGDALRTRNHIIGAMEMAAIEQDPTERARLLTFMVVGGGYGGVEVITEIDEFVRGLTERDYPSIDADEIRTVLVHSGERILEELDRHENLRRWAERHLEETTSIEMRMGTRVSAATGTEAVLSDGERIPTRTIISSTGTAQSPLLDGLPFERDDRGRLVTDRFVRVPSTDHVWAGGDCAAVPHPKGGTNPPVAIFAMATGWRIGRNILALLRGETPRIYRFRELGDACSLGHRKAVGHVRGLRVTGLPAWLMWRSLLLCFVPSGDRRLRIVLDWLVTPIFGRDASQLQLDETLAVRRELYEPGQDVVVEGEIGQRMYVIQSGQAEVLRTDDAEQQTVIGTLETGAHFGEVAVFEGSRRSATVRAVSRLEVLSLGRDLAQSLSSAAEPIGDHLRTSPGATTAAGPDHTTEVDAS